MAVMMDGLLERYAAPVPRYTSYPTAPHFHDGVGAASYAAWLEALPCGDALSLYCHVPFCDSLCWFCGCHTKIVRRYQPVAEYLRHAGTGDRAGFQDARCDTPPCSSALRRRRQPYPARCRATLSRLVSALCRRFTPSPDFELAVEIDPRDLSRDQVRCLVKSGPDTRQPRGSGFQSGCSAGNQPGTELRNDRARVVDWLRAAGVSGLNVDLMFGLPHQSVDHVLRTLDQVLGAVAGPAGAVWLRPCALDEDPPAFNSKRGSTRAGRTACPKRGGRGAAGRTRLCPDRLGPFCQAGRPAGQGRAKRWTAAQLSRLYQRHGNDGRWLGRLGNRHSCPRDMSRTPFPCATIVRRSSRAGWRCTAVSKPPLRTVCDAP